MLTEESNRAFTQVGPGTPMGELLRRYWMPIAAVAELDDTPIKPVRLMGEDLVLYRDEQRAAMACVDRHCAAPARRSVLRLGRGLRAALQLPRLAVRRDGRCLAQPFEETAHPEARFKDRVRIKAYPVEAKAGLRVGLPRAGAGAARADLGALHLGERLRADRLRRDPVQLVPVPGELHRPRALRVAAQQLVARRSRAAAAIGRRPT